MSSKAVKAQRTCASGSIGRRLVECVAMLMIGDGILAVIMPERHMKVWHKGPHLWEMMMRQFIKRPEMTRWLGAVELATGIWLAQKVDPDADGKVS
jgi:hypothetical protein